MERSVDPSSVQGAIQAPASKSMTQRAIAAALLSTGTSIIRHPSYCDDCLAAMSIAVGLGARIDPRPDEMEVTGSVTLKETKLNCGESGLAVRMFSPIASLYRSEILLTGANSLRKRPMSMIEEALTQLGVRCSTTDGFLPVLIHGPIKGGSCVVDGSVSSQLLTGLLMALPLAEKDSDITVINLKSKPYVDMTIGLLKDFGITVKNSGYQIFEVQGRQKYMPREYTVEGDWSGGAFLLVAGAINGDVTVSGLRRESLQSDKAIIEALKSAGANMTIEKDKIKISRSELRAFSFDATDAPDLFPPLVALAAYCHGVSEIRGVSRLIHKESDRATALVTEFGKLKIDIKVADDTMFVKGSRPEGARTESYEDHRIAMALAVAALGASGTVSIRDSQCVSKSYSSFFTDLSRLGAIVNE